jgi:4'-phosphopantetheinyl transferase EntD
VTIERVATAHGACVLVEGEADAARLPEAEQAFARTLTASRLREFVAGRTALHHALGDFAAPILADDRGAPLAPAGWAASISHKGGLAAALAARAGEGHVGLDVERAAPSRVDIARRILTPREQAACPDRGRAVTLRFSLKEAIYKAIDPTLRRYVGFLEVELDDVEGGACRVTTALPLAIEAAWLEHRGHWLSTARARPR